MGALDEDAPNPEQDSAPGEDQDAEQAPPGQQRFRYRIVYAKDGPLRYTSQLDLARIWERSLRRAGLALLYSQGFNPRPKVQLAVGLPLGYASRCEIVDAWLETEIPDEPPVIDRLNAASPRGLTVSDVRPVDIHAPSLQSLVWSTTYLVTFREPPALADLSRRVEGLLAQNEIWRERREKRVDLRPLIDRLSVIAEPAAGLEMRLAASAERGTARPDEVLPELGLDPAGALVVRTAIQFRPDASTG